MEEQNDMEVYQELARRLFQVTEEFKKEKSISFKTALLDVPTLIEKTQSLISNPMLDFASAIMYPVQDFEYDGKNYSLMLSVQENNMKPYMGID